MKRLFVFLLLVILLSAVIPLASAETIDINAKAALLIAPEGEVTLYEKNIHEKLYPASLTKIMTALVILKKASLDDVVTVTDEALADFDPDGSNCKLKVGEQMPMRDMLHCILVASANDACSAVAHHISGSEEDFAALMNEEAKALGCENTHFVNSHGLQNPEHYTTAADMYLITREAIKSPEFLEICNTATLKVPATNMSDERVFYTTNHLISINQRPEYIYHPAKGIKTGHTSDAGYCLVSSAEQNGMYLISVVLGAKKDADTGLIGSFTETKRLFEWGFSNFEHRTLVKSGEPVTEVKVKLARDVDYVKLVNEGSIETLLPKDAKQEDIKRDVKVFDKDGVTAPVAKGDVLGEMTVTYDGREYGKLSLIAANNVERDPVLYYMDKGKEIISKPWVMITAIGVVALVIIYTVFMVAHNLKRRRESRSYRGGGGRRH